MKRIFYMSLGSIVLIALALSIIQVWSENKAAQKMYKDFSTTLSTYPVLSNPFASSFCQFESEGIKYLTIQNDGEFITGVRLADGETTYCHNGITYQVSNDEMVETGYDMVDVNEIIGSNISYLLSDETVSYTYHKPSGRDLPLWIYPYDPAYLRIRRESYGECMETMMYSDTEQFEIRWCITKSSSDEDVELFLCVFDESISSSSLYIHGWGQVPDDILKILVTAE